jgi:hypothetical protein
VMHQTIDRGSRFSLNFARFSSSGKRESSSIASIRELSQSVTIANLEPLKVSRFCARHKKVYRGFMGRARRRLVPRPTSEPRRKPARR